MVHGSDDDVGYWSSGQRKHIDFFDFGVAKTLKVFQSISRKNTKLLQCQGIKRLILRLWGSIFPLFPAYSMSERYCLARLRF